MKIDIEIEDNRIYSILSLVLNRKEVREGIILLRHHFLKDKKYTSIKVWQKSYKLRINNPFDEGIIKLLETTGISPIFYPAIKEAVITGRVTKFDEILPIVIPYDILSELLTSQEDYHGNGKYEYALLITPEARPKDAQKAISDMFASIDAVKKTSSQELVDRLKQPSHKTRGSIHDVERWFWKNLSIEEGGEGKSAHQIAIDEYGSPAGFKEVKRIEKALERFKASLNQPPDIY